MIRITGILINLGMLDEGLGLVIGVNGGEVTVKGLTKDELMQVSSLIGEPVIITIERHVDPLLDVKPLDSGARL